ncbi:sugar phosphate isomerase/epimerase [Paenibacillaceae bacterium]|nr:sugar phosphate isomerase/epimerase [Paenibacillaceae bacterium]
MNRFMIGQYGAFDENKYIQDFKAGFYGVEACLMPEDEIDKLLARSQADGFRIGVHFPLRAGVSKLRDALFLSKDRTVRMQAYDLVERELAFLAAMRPEYVLFHYPKPVILDDRVDWSEWRFADRSEYEFESSYSLDELNEMSEALFVWLSSKGDEYHFTPVLEFDALNLYVYEDSFLEQLLEQHNTIRLCLDTARLYLQERLDPFFDSKAVIRRYAKFAATIHLSNMQINENNRIIHSRYPVLPTQDPHEGWAPIEAYLQIIKQENKSAKIMFEHRSDLVNEDELWQCYQWVDGLLS